MKSLKIPQRQSEVYRRRIRQYNGQEKKNKPIQWPKEELLRLSNINPNANPR
jgi:hypothetical protein